ncbi:MAG: toll/interleukin-1 receptor domain-containing protein [Coriobacteriia bacterium]
MEPRLGKPRVFLSHCKADLPFITRLDSALRECQIDTWLDSIDIPHGHPWLDAIFRDGIPACDAAMVYLTPAALDSVMVKKEIDAAMIQQLQDERIAFLPYVSSSDIRIKLRADIQALQAPEWNESNYEQLLPRVVAEIWRSYLGRTVVAAVADERVKRLQAELALQELRGKSAASVFTPAEEAEFEQIWATLDRTVVIHAKVTTPSRGDGDDVVEPALPIGVQLGSYVALVIAAGYEFSAREGYSVLNQPVKDFVLERVPGALEVSVEDIPSVTDELTMYGLLDRVVDTTPMDGSALTRTVRIWSGPNYWSVWTNKSQRLRYWLAYNDRLPTSVELSEGESSPLT